jgi:hypothetical protein
MQNFWLFQASHETYPLTKVIPPLLGRHDFWLPKRHLQDIEKEDRVIIWQSGLEAGAYALGTVADKPYKKKGQWRVDIRYDRMLTHPHYKSDLQRHRVLRSLDVLSHWWMANPFRVDRGEWQALIALDKSDTQNIFNHYSQEENQFTNDLVSLLALSRHDGDWSITDFLCQLLQLKRANGISSFRVLRQIDGTADAELTGPNCCIRLETKIAPDGLREDQIHRHLERLCDSAKPLKALVLLTPDDSASNTIRRLVQSREVRKLCSKSKGMRVIHLEWKQVYRFLEQAVRRRVSPIFSEIAAQFLRRIHDRIADADFVGVIQKISFGDHSGVYAKSTDAHVGYLEELETTEWGSWDTPKVYKQLSGTGRKLLLYDKTRQEITVEMEIESVRERRTKGDFPCRNVIAPGTLRVLPNPIPVSHIVKIAGFEGFLRGQAAARNVTREQHALLTARTDDRL